MTEVRREIDQRRKHEAALVQTRVWNLEPSGMHREVAVEEDIDIKRPGSTHRTDALAAEREFDLLDSREQHHGEQVGLHLDHHVPELALLLEIHGLGLVNG